VPIPLRQGYILASLGKLEEVGTGRGLSEDGVAALLIVGSWVQGLMGLGVQGFRGSGAQGFMGSGVHGLRGSWAQGFRGSGVQGFKGSAGA
ncbi:MAG: hypothetical protein PWP06_1748, partial [Candidatus Marinimicrobia bacterium]|nr:hypothetical protein [Candidatus Neomarinimicrobiota bacterium]